MNYIIKDSGQEINRIVSDESFVATYCKENNYTYELIPELIQEPEPEPEPNESSVYDELDGAYQEGVNSAYDS